MIKLIYKNKQSYLTHSFPEYINNLEELKIITLSTWQTKGLFCNNGCGAFADALFMDNDGKSQFKIKNGEVFLYIHGWTIKNIDNYDNLFMCYYTCEEIMIKNVLY